MGPGWAWRDKGIDDKKKHEWKPVRKYAGRREHSVPAGHLAASAYFICESRRNNNTLLANMAV